MDERDRHAAFAHPARYTLDRTMTNVARAKYAGKTRLQRKRLAIERPRSQVSSGANIAFGVALQGVVEARIVFAVAPIIRNSASASRVVEI